METIDLINVAREQSPSSLLGLSSSIRQRIYSHVGLAPTDRYGLPYVFQLHGSNRKLRLCPNTPEFCGFHGLLVSCRTLHYEVSKLLYSTNRFIIRYGEHSSLERLRRLTPLALSNLRHLKIVLNEASCHSTATLRSELGSLHITDDHRSIHNGANGTNQKSRLGLTHHDTVLLGDEGGLKLLAEWERTVDHLSSRVSAAALDLSVVCDIFDQDIDVAKRVVSPLALLPLLKNCHVRLSHVPVPEMNRLARDAALKACGKFNPLDHMLVSCLPAIKTPPPLWSSLMALPLEIRLHILEFSDLITPWKEVTWHRKDHAFTASRTYCTSVARPGADCEVHNGCQFVDCWLTFPEPSIGCFCRLKHSAFSSNCKCWEPPLPLFLVCRTLYKEAQTVFFSQNSFVIHDGDPMKPLTAPAERPAQRLAASVLLNEAVPRDCLAHLRSLEFVFPAYDHRLWPGEGQPDLLDWINTITMAKDKFNLPALTIRLVMARSDRIVNQPRRRLRTELSNAEGQAILAAYDRILSPIVQLGGQDGLAGFYADFEWPWARTTDALEKGCEWVKSHKRPLDERAGKLVLGQDRFEHQSTSESSAWGAAASLWARRRIHSALIGT